MGLEPKNIPSYSSILFKFYPHKIYVAFKKI